MTKLSEQSGRPTRIGHVIPNDRPVLGNDLEKLQYALGATVDEMRWLLGINAKYWNLYTKIAPRETVPKPALALLVRFYGEYPDAVPLRPRLNPQAVYEALGGTLKRLSLRLGTNETTGHRWIRKQTGFAPTTERLAHHMLEMSKDDKGIAAWEALVEKEAKARGIDDIWAAGSWSPE